MAEKEQPVAMEVTESGKKHPLQNKWTLWYLMGEKAKHLPWEQRLKPVASFDTVEDFWALINFINPPSKLDNGSDYMLFKDGIRPMWEDQQNKAGGRWLLNMEKRKKDSIDTYWEETLMLMIGELLGECSDEVCGAVVQLRPKGLKLAIWTRDARNEAYVKRIGEVFKQQLFLDPMTKIKYERHDNTASKSGSTAKASFTL